MEALAKPIKEKDGSSTKKSPPSASIVHKPSSPKKVTSCQKREGGNGMTLSLVHLAAAATRARSKIRREVQAHDAKTQSLPRCASSSGAAPTPSKGPTKATAVAPAATPMMMKEPRAAMKRKRVADIMTPEKKWRPTQSLLSSSQKGPKAVRMDPFHSKLPKDGTKTFSNRRLPEEERSSRTPPATLQSTETQPHMNNSLGQMAPTKPTMMKPRCQESSGLASRRLTIAEMILKMQQKEKEMEAFVPLKKPTYNALQQAPPAAAPNLLQSFVGQTPGMDPSYAKIRAAGIYPAAAAAAAARYHVPPARASEVTSYLPGSSLSLATILPPTRLPGIEANPYLAAARMEHAVYGDGSFLQHHR